MLKFGSSVRSIFWKIFPFCCHYQISLIVTNTFCSTFDVHRIKQCFSHISSQFNMHDCFACKSKKLLHASRWEGHWFWSVSRWGAALSGWSRWPDGCYSYVLQQRFPQHTRWTRCSGHFAHPQWHAGVLLNLSRFVLSKTYPLINIGDLHTNAFAGYVSWRDTQAGSWYVENLDRVLEQNADTDDLVTMLMMVRCP